MRELTAPNARPSGQAPVGAPWARNPERSGDGQWPQLRWCGCTMSFLAPPHGHGQRGNMDGAGRGGHRRDRAPAPRDHARPRSAMTSASQQGERALWDRLLLDLEQRAGQVRRLKSPEPRRLLIQGLAAGAVLLGAGAALGAILVRWSGCG